MSKTGSTGRPSKDSTSAAVGGSEVPGVQQHGDEEARRQSSSSTGPMPVHMRTDGGGPYDWRGSKHNHPRPRDPVSDADKPKGLTPRPPTPPSPTTRHTISTNSTTGPLPSRLDFPSHRKVYSRPQDVAMPSYTTSSTVPRPLDSPTYNSGNLSSGNMSSGNMSSGEFRRKMYGEASSFGSSAKMVTGNASFPFDKEQMKPIPKPYPDTKPAAPAQSTGTLPTTEDQKSRGNVPPRLSGGEGADENISHSNQSSIRSDGRSGTNTPGLSGGEGSGVSRSYSTQSSVLTEGGYSTQESSEHTDDECKILMKTSIGLGAAKKIRRDSQMGGGADRGSVGSDAPLGGGVDHGDAEGLGQPGGDSEGHVDGGKEDEVAKRPYQREVSTGKGDHVFCALGRGSRQPANSIGGLKPGNEGDAESAENSDQTQANLLSRKQDEINDLKRQLDERDRLLLKLRDSGGAQDLRSQLDGYDEQRHKNSELQRLQSVEEHEKHLQLEFGKCKKDRDTYEGQVVQLMEQWSLMEKEKKELSVKCDQLSAEREEVVSLYEENAKLKEELASLRKEVLKKDTNVKKMKDRVKTLTQQRVALGDGQGGLLSLSSVDVVEGMAGSEDIETEVQRQASQSLTSGSGLGVGHEVELTSLRKEVAEKDQQLSKLEDMAKNMTAMMTYSERSSAAIKHLTEKCEGLEAENDQLLADRNKIASGMAELSSVSEGLKVEVESLRKEKLVFDSSSELEEANKQVQLLQEQLEERQRLAEKQARELKSCDTKLKKCEESINNLQQEVVLHHGLSQNMQQELLTSQQVASDLSSKCEQQAMEVRQLKKEKEDLFGELEAQKVMSAGYEEDFNDERKDREKAHSKMADMEMQYKDQFNKLGQELAASQQRCGHLERTLKDVESHYQAQVSQVKYSTGDKDKTINKLRVENKKLEEELASKMQQVKQYKKQADHHVTELNSFKDVHAIQKTQIQGMGMENEKLLKQIDLLKRENMNFKARDRHSAATGQGGRTGGGATLDVERKRIHELEGSVEELQVTNAILQSQVEQLQKQAPPPQSQTTSISSSSSCDRVGQRNSSAVPGRPPPMVLQGKASSVDSPIVNPRVRRDQPPHDTFSTPVYSDHSKQLPSLQGGGVQQRSHIPSHAPSHYSNTGSRMTQPPLDPYGNARTGVTGPPRAGHYTTSNADYPTVSSLPYPKLQGMGGATRPSGHAGGQYRLPMQGVSAGDASALAGMGRGNNLISRNYASGFGSSGPASLPGLVSPEHQSDPHRGGVYGPGHSRDDMDLRGASDIVEKDSPPTSFVSPPGPSSLNVQQPQGNSFKSHSHQHRGQGARSVVEGVVRPVGPNQLQGQSGSRIPNTSTGYRMGPGTSNGSRMRPSTSAGSGIGQIRAAPQPSTRGQDLHVPINYPLQETAASSVHAPHAPPPPLQQNTLSSLSGNRLEVGIDREIVSAADEVKTQVGGEGEEQGEEDAPIDPNLVCPTCQRKFRIGQIQLFRQHAASCNNKV